MRRFLTLVSMLCLAIPAGISISGCTRNPAGNYCNGLGYGLSDTQVASIVLQPQVAGISLAYGQTLQAQSPTAYTCKGSAAVVGQKSYTWGTSNNQLVDVSPIGDLCAGTWNRNTGGGIADYTYCYPPNPLPVTNGLPYGVAYLTASANSVSSNPVEIYVHAAVTSIALDGPTKCESQGTVAQLDSEACYVNNGVQYEFCAPASIAPANYACPGKLAPGITSVPTCESSIGTMSYDVVTSSVASINSTTNQITAEQPGTTAITASIAQSGSSAGYFSTCPPASISLTLANGATSGTVAQGQAEGVTTTVLDTNGQAITGLSLTYQSTDPFDITVGTNGSISTQYPGTAAVNAICQPSTCNPAPINEIGLNGTGVSISSNPVAVTVPGTASDFAWFASPGNSQYVVPVELLTGAVGSSIRLPYVPNSMVMDRLGSALYLGSAHELMTVSTGTNAISKQDTTVPGVVLAASPNAGQLLINDQARHLFYIYPTSGGTPVTFGGMGAAAQWTPDSQTLYVYDNSQLNTAANPNCGSVVNANPITGHTDTLYVYNVNTGWTVDKLLASPPLPAGALTPCDATPNTAMPVMQQIPAVMIPGVGAYLSGNPTTAHTWCPTGTVGDNSMVQFYPQGDSQAVQSDIVNTTIGGAHILGATANAGGSITINDILDPIPAGETQSNGVATPQECKVTTAGSVQTMQSLLINNGGATANFTQATVTGVDASAANQVVTGSIPESSSAQTVASNIAFITYEPASTTATTNATLPYYLPASTGVGSVGYVTLNVSSSCTNCGTITAPVAGAFTPDHTLFFVSTSGDNEVHYISLNPQVNATTPPKDTQEISPQIPSCTPPPPLGAGNDAGCTYTGGAAIVPATVIYVKPRSTT